mmetsp:Transcript_41079/g.85529  ORF Transcript_41079/g.85529 Transcript_41079/m.85529 type:complete len:94 (-) Transcript_41079:52-333(-)
MTATTPTMTLTAMATVLLATMLVPINALAFAAPPITPFSCCSHLLPQQQPPPIVETTKTEVRVQRMIFVSKYPQFAASYLLSLVTVLCISYSS